jgi:hypothetical protein
MKKKLLHINLIFAVIFASLNVLKAQGEAPLELPQQNLPGYALLSELNLEEKLSSGTKKELELKVSKQKIVLGRDSMVEFSAKSKWAKDYIWKFGDGSSLSGFQHVQHMYEKPGKYQVILIASNEDEASRKEIEIEVLANPSALEIKEMGHYFVFPNNNKLLTDIQLDLPKREKRFRVEIKDNRGVRVFEKKYGRVKKDQIISLDLSNLEDGRYYAILKGKKYSVLSKVTIVR